MDATHTSKRNRFIIDDRYLGQLTDEQRDVIHGAASTPDGDLTMTRAQARMVPQIIAAQILREAHRHVKDVEIKELEISTSDSTLGLRNSIIFVVIETGGVNDEGTYAEIFCRTRRMWAVYSGGRIVRLSHSENCKSDFVKRSGWTATF